MAEKRQPKQDASPDSTRGGGQAVVSLCKISESSLVFWSRHRFDLAAELQVRVRCDVLPLHVRATLKPDNAGWVSVRGFVIECRAQRRSNGAGVFRVSLLLDAALISSGRGESDVQSGSFWGGRSGALFGLN